MRAILLSEFGGPDVLRLQHTPRPRPRADGVLVRVHATSINPLDCRIRRGELAVPLPAILGCDVSGVVEAIGEEVEDFGPGDQVLYMSEPCAAGGGYAEFHLARQHIVARKPANLTHVEAAGLPTAAGTAWEALILRGMLRIGETVLILGGGPVALFGVQIARAAGAQAYVVCRPDIAPLVLRLGAVRAIDQDAEHFPTVIRDETSDAAVDIVLDTREGPRLERADGVTKAHGRIVSTDQPCLGLGETVARNLTHHSVFPEPDRSRLDMLRAATERGQVVPVIDSVLPLSGAAAAHRRAESARPAGKLILEVASAS